MTDGSTLTRAQHLLELGRPDEAEPLVRDFLIGNPQSASALRLLASLLVALHRPDEALQAVTQSLSVDPESAHAFIVLAQIQDSRGDHTAAVAASGRAVRLAPHAWWAHIAHAQALRNGRRPQTRLALQAARQAVALAPHEPDAHNLAGICFDDMGDPATARLAYLEALRLDPSHAPALNNLAALDANGGQLGSAARRLKETLATDPQLKVARGNLDVVVVKFAWRAMIALLVLAAALLGELVTGAAWWVRASTWVVALGVLSWPTKRFLGHLPQGITRWGRGLWRRVGWNARRVLALTGLGVLSVTVMAFAPAEIGLVTGGVLFGLLRVTGMLMIGYFVIRSVSSLVRGD